MQPAEDLLTDTAFVICRRRRNHPQISPLVCEQRCKRIKGCPAYLDYLQPALFPRYDRRQAKGREKDLEMTQDL